MILLIAYHYAYHTHAYAHTHTPPHRVHVPHITPCSSCSNPQGAPYEQQAEPERYLPQMQGDGFGGAAPGAEFGGDAGGGGDAGSGEEVEEKSFVKSAFYVPQIPTFNRSNDGDEPGERAAQWGDGGDDGFGRGDGGGGGAFAPIGFSNFGGPRLKM